MKHLSDTDQAPYSAPAPQTATVSDEAVQAFCESYYGWWKNEAKGIVRQNVMPNVTRALTAALPHLALSAAPCSVEVKKLTWRDVDAVCAWCYAKSPFGEYRVTWSFNEAGQKLHFPDGTTKQFNEKGYGDRDAAKAAAQADFERRILSQIVTKTVDAAAVRRQAFEEAKAIAFDTSENGQYMGNGDCSGHSIYQQGATEVYDALCDLISDISPAEPVDQWQDIATAPKDGGTFLAVNIGEVERWHTTQEGVIITVKANDRPMTCAFYNDDDGTPVFTDEFGEVYTLDGVVCDAEGLTAAENVLRLTFWMPLPAAPTSKGGE